MARLGTGCCRQGWGAPAARTHTSLPTAVPELAARGVIQQVFPVHEQRILNRLMKSWVQAVCENQPLGVAPKGLGFWVGRMGRPRSAHG